jgi:peptidoglycan/xylan/chitin deacetylase (PgdA/CDA1 family)
MKTTLMAALFLMSASAFADFSQTQLGADTHAHDKAFNKHNQERLHTGTKEIILTFDDGPTPGVTDKILDTLRDTGAKGTFFVVAKNAIEYPALMKRILDEGHLVANHSLSHKPLNDTKFFNWKKTITSEIFGAHEILAPYMSGQNFYYRAPEGAWDTKFADFLNQSSVGRQYIGPILWDIGGAVEMRNGQYVQAADWACWSKKMTVDECLSGYLYEARSKKGGVVLMHDLRRQSAEMLAKFIPALQQNGFTFRTLDDVDWSGRK